MYNQCMVSGLTGQTGKAVVNLVAKGHNSDIDYVLVQNRPMEEEIVLVCLWVLSLVQSGSVQVYYDLGVWAFFHMFPPVSQRFAPLKTRTLQKCGLLLKGKICS